MTNLRHEMPARTGLVALWIAAGLGAMLTASAYWPGLMTWDPVRQYGEALSGEIDDWHPPVMQWLWQRLLMIHTGPASMLLTQLALYWGGLALLASALWLRGRRTTGWVLLACGLLPLGLALTGAILKDCLMAGALLLATGCIALRQGRGSVVAAVAGLVAIGLLLFAATLRFNGFLAALPLLLALLPQAWRGTMPRLAVATLVSAAVLVAAMPFANRLIGARPSGVELSLVIFDLGGMTEYSGTSMFPAQLNVADPVSVNHHCYRAMKWDSYSDWVEPECPLGFTAWNERVMPTGISPYRLLVRAVLAHPIAYAEHRLAHFAINTRLVPLPDSIERPVPIRDAPNEWGFHVVPGMMQPAIDGLAVASAHSPLGWPILWIALALGALIAGWDQAEAGLIVPLALSALLYGAGYVVFSVAAELRYHLWTELAALLATVLLLAGWRSIGRVRLLWAYAPALAVLVAGTVMRAVS